MARVLHLSYGGFAPVCPDSMTMATRMELLETMITAVRRNGDFQAFMWAQFNAWEPHGAFDSGTTHIKADVQTRLMDSLEKLNILFNFHGIQYNCHDFTDTMAPLVLADIRCHRNVVSQGICVS